MKEPKDYNSPYQKININLRLVNENKTLSLSPKASDTNFEISTDDLCILYSLMVKR